MKAASSKNFANRMFRTLVQVLAFGAIISVFWIGISAAMQHWLTPENKAKFRLKRSGYEWDLASAFQAVDRNDKLALERLQLIGVDLRGLNEDGFTTLGWAARQDRNEAAKTLLDLGLSYEERDGLGRTALSHAIENQRYHIARLLLEKGGNPNVEIEPEMPALAWSIREKWPEMVDLLLNHEADPNLTGKEGCPLSLAIAAKDLRLATKLLGRGANANRANAEGTPLLIASLQMEWPEMTRLLIEQGADPDEEYEPGMSGGVLALQMKRPDLATQFLEAGADPNQRGHEHPSILQAAFTHRNHDLFVMALEKGGNLQAAFPDKTTLLQRAVQADDRVWVERLLKYGAKPDVGAPGIEPMWWTQLQDGNRRMSELLLEAGADVNAEVNEGRRAIDVAIDEKNIGQARFLFEHGARSSGYLWRTLVDRNYAMLRFLLANGEDSSKLSSEGITPIGYCIMTGDLTAAAVLMEYGAVIDTSEKPGGHSLLEWAIANRQLPIAERLLDVGINPNLWVTTPVSDVFLEKFEDKGLRHYLVAESKVTPLMIVASTGQHDMAKALLKHGAKTGVYTGKYKTWPINFATRVDDVQMTQIILGRDPSEKAQKRKIIISLASQRASLYVDGKVELSTRVSTGKSGYGTPKGTFVITNKDRTRISNLYDAEMPYFMRLSCSAIGMHQGYVPSYPASHGCIRLPEGFARKFFYTAKIGDIVIIQ